MNTYSVLIRPITTEKAVRLLEKENVLLLEVYKHATKPLIRRAVEDIFHVTVTDVRTQISWKGIKRAYVRLSSDTPAMDVITQLGLM